MHTVYHWILQAHSISCKIEICSHLVTVPASFICCKSRLVTNDFNLVCLHITSKTTNITNNDMIAENKQENIYDIITRKEIFHSFFLIL